ncbi:hypothetical protein [Streptomyces sp. NPDC048057]|uniref:hypothetical protein n=1 Tax=Streptomyces sp. NPDC048057 TaxID=3155628 RepID=UPI0033D1F6BB
MSARHDLIDEYGRAETGTAPWTLAEFQQRLAEVRADERRATWLAAAAIVDNDDTCDCGGCDTCTLRRYAALLREQAGAPPEAEPVSARDEIRAAVLREAAEVADAEATRLYDDMGQAAAAGARAVAERLRAMAGEARPASDPLASVRTQLATSHTRYPDSAHCQHDGAMWPCPTMRAVTTAGEPVTIPPAVAEHILWHEYRDPAGYPPGGYLRQLLTAWSYADDEHSRRLAAAYPAYGAAYPAYGAALDISQQPDGVDRLRQISAAAAQGGDAG